MLGTHENCPYQMILRLSLSRFLLFFFIRRHVVVG